MQMQLAGGHGPRPLNGQATPALPPDVVTATQRGRVSTYLSIFWFFLPSSFPSLIWPFVFLRVQPRPLCGRQLILQRLSQRRTRSSSTHS